LNTSCPSPSSSTRRRRYVMIGGTAPLRWLGYRGFVGRRTHPGTCAPSSTVLAQNEYRRAKIPAGRTTERSGVVRALETKFLLYCVGQERDSVLSNKTVRRQLRPSPTANTSAPRRTERPRWRTAWSVGPMERSNQAGVGHGPLDRWKKVRRTASLALASRPAL